MQGGRNHKCFWEVCYENEQPFPRRVVLYFLFSFCYHANGSLEMYPPQESDGPQML